MAFRCETKGRDALPRAANTLVVAVGLLLSSSAAAQSLDVTFRYVPQPGDNFVRAFLPGEFNNWGPNSNGTIAVGAPSAMTFDDSTGEWSYEVTLQSGIEYSYKIHFHYNESGSNSAWISDPTNPRIDAADNNNSLVLITDPIVFQLTRRQDGDGNIDLVSAGVFGSQVVDSLTFEINGVEADGLPYFDADSRIFRYQLPEPVPAGSQFKLTATDALGAVITEEVGLIPPVVEDAPLPAGIRDGINYDEGDATHVTLSLFAPHKNYVYVIGDFNDWTPDPDFLMKRDSINADSVRYWLSLTTLTPGVEYAFQYLVDGTIRVADPYSPKVLVAGADAQLGSVYPGLKPYPTDETQHPVSVFQTAQSAFEWQHQDYDRPKQGELVIYEMLLRDFLAAHDYDTMVDTLAYFERLGVNAIELMPVTEYGGNDSWGYDPDFHLALDKYYGPADDFKRFVEACHARGIAVIMDVVYNHVTDTSPLARLYGGAANPDNVYLNASAPHPFAFFNDVNHESTATRYWLDRANEYWITEFDIDGFRFDLSKGFTQRNSGGNIGFWGSHDPGRIATLKRMADHIWSVDSTTYVILEHLADNDEEQELAEYGLDEGRPGMMLWANLNHVYSEAAMGYNAGSNSDVTSGYFGTRNWSVPNLVTYMESHDEQWLMFKNLSFGACVNAPAGGNTCDTDGGPYNIRELDIALDRQKLVGAFLFLVPGPKMMWQFGELGYGYGPDGRDCLRPGDGTAGDCPSNSPQRVGRKPIRWEDQDDPLRAKLYRTWSTLIHLRRENPVFHDAIATRSGSLSGEVKTLVLDHPFEMDAVVVGNFAVSSRTASPGFLSTGMWYDYFTGDSLEVTDPSMTIELQAGEFHVYTTERLPAPEQGLITVDTEPQGEQVERRLALGQAYPNPASSTVVVEFELAESGAVDLRLFDVLGREVAVLVQAERPIGAHTEEVDVSHLAAGVYFFRLVSGSAIRTNTVIIRP